MQVTFGLRIYFWLSFDLCQKIGNLLKFRSTFPIFFLNFEAMFPVDDNYQLKKQAEHAAHATLREHYLHYDVIVKAGKMLAHTAAK